MLTANELKNIDFFLMKQQQIVNQPADHKQMIAELREMIAEELGKIKIEIKRL